jgi:hypothetical protein
MDGIVEIWRNGDHSNKSQFFDKTDSELKDEGYFEIILK